MDLVGFVSSYLSLYSAIQISLALIAVWYLKDFFKDEYRRIPKFTVSVPKVMSGTITENEQVLGKEQICCYNPATLEKLGTSPVMSTEQVGDAVQKAREAQKKWSQTSFAERRRVLRTLLHFVEENKDELMEMSVKETGKTKVDSIFGEVFISLEKINWVIKNGERYLSPDSRSPGFMMHKKAWVQYCPYGVIGVIIPWNFPLHNALSHIVTALIGGNAAVIKVSEWASWSVHYLRETFQQLFIATGHSPDLVQFVTGYAETGTALINSCDKILFIGSPEVGKKVMETASRTLTPVTLELGGKDPFIVCEDASLDYTVQMALRGAFLNCGQNCLSAERYYVYEGIYDKFIARLMEMVPKITQGPDSPDAGAVNLPSQLDKYKILVDDAVSKGAKILAGGKVNTSHKGHFWEPTVLVDVDHSMRIVQEEAFGPIMSILKVKTDEEVVRLANESDYGLSCSIYSSSSSRALKLAHQIESGSVVVNDWGLSMMVLSVPTGGVKISGFGKFNGPEGLRDFCYQKSFVIPRFNFLTFTPPAPIMYPVWPNAHSYVQSFIRILYGRTLGAQAGGVMALLKQIVTGK